MKKIKILIIDDHKMIRDGIRLMLEVQEKKYKFIIDEAEDGEEGVNKANKKGFDIIIMDYQLPEMNGADATRQIISHNINAKILALSNYDEYMYIDNMLKAGAKGFILKNISPEELLTAIEIILSGKNYYSNDVAIRLISHKKITHENEDVIIIDKNPKEMPCVLSKREIEILRFISNEFTNEEIASKLAISKRTVDAHRQNMMSKLKVKNTVGLVKYAIEFFSN